MPVSTVKPYMGTFNRLRYADVFAKFGKAGSKKPVYRIYIPIDGSIKKAVEAPGEIIEFLNSKGMTVDDYRAGTAKLPDGRRSVKIGKVLSEVPALKKQFDNDSSRAASKGAAAWVVISRHPYDILGMSFDRGWTSCMNVEKGSNADYLKKDVKYGTLVAYLVKNDDKNINRPMARIALRPFVKTGGYSVFVPGPVYGTASEHFHGAVVKFCAEMNKSSPTGVYKHRENLYNDDQETSIFHLKQGDPVEGLSARNKAALASSTPDIEILQYFVSEKPSEAVARALTDNGNAPSEILEKLYGYHIDSAYLEVDILRHRSLSDKFIAKILPDVKQNHYPIICLNKNVSSTTLDTMADLCLSSKQLSLRALSAIVASDRLSEKTMLKLIGALDTLKDSQLKTSEGRQFLMTLLRDERCTVKVLKKYAFSKDFSRRVANNPAAPVSLLMSMYENVRDTHVRCLILDHKAIPQDFVLSKLEAASPDLVTAFIEDEPELSKEVFELLCTLDKGMHVADLLEIADNFPFEFTLYALDLRPDLIGDLPYNVAEDRQEQLFNHFKDSRNFKVVKYLLGMDAELDRNYLDDLVACDDPKIRAYMAGVSDIDDASRDQLALDTEPDVRFALAEGFDTPKYILLKLLNDPVAKVAARAKKALKRHN